MLELRIDSRELYDERTELFYYSKAAVLKLEHSLISISKWESKWKKPFLDKTEKTRDELNDYIKCMTLNTNVDDSTYLGLTQSDYNAVSQYINDEMTATWFNENSLRATRAPNSNTIITSELIYYWMITYDIPAEYQKWHLNRLLTLIRICEIKNQPKKKMKRQDILSSNRALNAARKRASGSKG